MFLGVTSPTKDYYCSMIISSKQGFALFLIKAYVSGILHYLYDRKHKVFRLCKSKERKFCKVLLSMK